MAILLISTHSKTLDKITKIRIINFFYRHNVISESLYGSEGRSTEDAISILQKKI